MMRNDFGSEPAAFVILNRSRNAPATIRDIWSKVSRINLTPYSQNPLPKFNTKVNKALYPMRTETTLKSFVGWEAADQ